MLFHHVGVPLVQLDTLLGRELSPSVRKKTKIIVRNS